MFNGTWRMLSSSTGCGLKRILIIEDEQALAEALKYTLEREGYEVDIECDGARGLKRFQEKGADLVLLDIMLPGLDGIEICRRIRVESRVPIMMLTAKDSDIDEVLGLEMGADDYITKPFVTRKLVARIKAVFRRAEGRALESAGRKEWGGIVLDSDKHEVFTESGRVHLTPIEYRILETLMNKPGKALSRETLLNQAWFGDFYGSPKTLDVHIRHLREKLEKDPANPVYITTVRGVGYRLEKPE